MKITVKHYDQTIIIEEKRDDLTLGEMIEIFKRVLGAMGYHPDTINEYFIDEQ
jgi:hypothetical protein